MLEKYYKLLELPEGAQEGEIKRAYKRKAKLLHPDVNKSPDAHHEFLLIQEAYENLISQHEILEKKPSDDSTNNNSKQHKKKDSIWNPVAFKLFGIGYAISFFVVLYSSHDIFIALLIAIFLAFPVTIFVAFFFQSSD